MQMHTGTRARAWLARRLRRRPPFWMTLVFVSPLAGVAR
jgi:hypothetical protein